MIENNPMRIHIRRTVIDNLSRSLDSSLQLVLNELKNTRKVDDQFAGTGFMEIDKTELNKQIGALTTVLKIIQKIK